MSEEKLNELKEKTADLPEELKKLTPEEMEQIFGGAGGAVYSSGANTEGKLK